MHLGWDKSGPDSVSRLRVNYFPVLDWFVCCLFDWVLMVVVVVVVTHN